MTAQPSASLPHMIQQLLEQRSSHVKALAVIDATLERVNTALSGSTRRVVASAVPKATPAKGKKKGRQSGPTAADFVLDFIKEKKNPTSREINAAWKSAGRNWTADITLSKLTKAKKLARTPLGVGQLGSRYAIAT